MSTLKSKLVNTGLIADGDEANQIVSNCASLSQYTLAGTSFFLDKTFQDLKNHVLNVKEGATSEILEAASYAEKFLAAVSLFEHNYTLSSVYELEVKK